MPRYLPNDAEKLIAANLADFGLTKEQAYIYVALLRHGPQTLQNLLLLTRLPADVIERSLASLVPLFIIGKQIYRHKLRYYAINPTISWKWLQFEIVWQGTDGIVKTFYLPELDDAQAEKRRQLLNAICQQCTLAYKPKGASSVTIPHGRTFVTADEYAYACSEAIALAQHRIIAVEKAPRLPHLSILWSAITERRFSGIPYYRCVPLDEVMTHGLDIVERDIQSFGIDLRILPEKAIKKGFYLVDSEYVLVKYPAGETAEAFGALIRKPEIVARYQDRASRHLERAVSVADLLPSLRQRAESLVSATTRQYSSQAYAEALRKITSLGRFAELTTKENEAARVLVHSGILERVATERYRIRLTSETVPPTLTPVSDYLPYDPGERQAK